MKIKITSCYVLLLMLFGCTSIPEGITPVKTFNPEQYMGRWYEIARLDHSFESGLTDVFAEYAMNRDGSIEVVNQGWSADDHEWRKARGKAKLMATPDVGFLKVSFFGPFYSSYIVFYLEDDGSVALVSGYKKKYFWIMARHREIPESQLRRYISLAKQHGFDTNNLIYPVQTLEQ